MKRKSGFNLMTKSKMMLSCNVQVSSLQKLLFVFFICNFCISVVSLGQNTDSTSTDSVLLKQIEAQMNQAQTPTSQPRSTLSFNPDIGVIGDFQGSYISKGDKNFDMYLNETEISLQAVVDPYIRADFFLSFGRDPATN